MRARNLKPGFFANEQLAELPHETRLLFIGLWCCADREGRLEDRPKRIRAQVFPYEDADVDAMLTDLAEAGFITRYEVDGAKYIEINNFLKHQSPHHKEAESIIPSMPQACLKHASSMSQACPKQVASFPLIPDSGFSDSGLTDSRFRIPDSEADRGLASTLPEPRPTVAVDEHTARDLADAMRRNRENAARSASRNGAAAVGNLALAQAAEWERGLSGKWQPPQSLEVSEFGRKIAALVGEPHKAGYWVKKAREFSNTEGAWKAIASAVGEVDSAMTQRNEAGKGPPTNPAALLNSKLTAAKARLGMSPPATPAPAA
jgi:hypothetical protein